MVKLKNPDDNIVNFSEVVSIDAKTASTENESKRYFKNYNTNINKTFFCLLLLLLYLEPAMHRIEVYQTSQFQNQLVILAQICMQPLEIKSPKNHKDEVVRILFVFFNLFFK